MIAIPGPVGGDITVVIPSRDRGDRIAATIASVNGQTTPPAETIVVDDGSTVPVPHRPGVRVIRHERGRGVAAARNAGILAAETEWVALLDDDDLWAPRKLELQLAAASATAAGWVFGAALIVDEEGGLLETSTPPAADRLKTALREGNVIPAGSSNVLARRSALIDAGLFDEDFHHYADWDLWLRLAETARPASIPDPIVGYVRHAASMQITEIDSAQHELAALARKHAKKDHPALGSIWIDQWVAEGLDGAGHRTRALALLTRSAIQRRSARQARFALEHLARTARRSPVTRHARAAAPTWANPATFRPPVD